MKKDKAEKDKTVAEKQAAIDEAEHRTQRSTRAKLDGTATEEDERYYREINAEIGRLREEKRKVFSFQPRQPIAPIGNLSCYCSGHPFYLLGNKGVIYFAIENNFI